MKSRRRYTCMILLYANVQQRKFAFNRTDFILLALIWYEFIYDYLKVKTLFLIFRRFFTIFQVFKRVISMQNTKI